MGFTWRYTEQARNDLNLIQQKIAVRIIKKIRHFCTSDDPFTFAKPLHGTLKGLFRFRIGEYRVIFQKDPTGQMNILLILRIKNRKEVYE